MKIMRHLLLAFTFFCVFFAEISVGDELCQIIAIPSLNLVRFGEVVVVEVQVKNTSKKPIQVPNERNDESGLTVPAVYSLRIDGYTKKNIWERINFYERHFGSHSEANFRDLAPDQIVVYKIPMVPFWDNSRKVSVSHSVARVNLYCNYDNTNIKKL